MTYKGYFIDLDGTMYRGKEEIDGAKQFITYLQTQNIPHLFITNNATATQADVVAKLKGFDIHTTTAHILTSAVATAYYLKQHDPYASCFVIGESGLRTALKEAGLQVEADSYDYVVMGLDRHITYDKLAEATIHIQQGAQLIATNRDAAIPTERGLLPGNGSLVSAIVTATKATPIVIGKPAQPIMGVALDMIGLSSSDVLMIGDNYETDILAGINQNIDTLLVLTGFSSKEDMKTVAKQPTYIAEDLHAWLANKLLTSDQSEG